MILISLLLAATPAPALGPVEAARSETAKPDRARLAARSKRMIELEAAVRSLAAKGERTETAPGPEGL